MTPPTFIVFWTRAPLLSTAAGELNTSSCTPRINATNKAGNQADKYSNPADKPHTPRQASQEVQETIKDTSAIVVVDTVCSWTK